MRAFLTSWMSGITSSSVILRH